MSRRTLLRTASSDAARIVFLALILFGITAVLAVAGRANFVLVHAFYLAIFLAAYWFRIPGGVIAGLLAGLGASPYLVPGSTPVGQGDMAWLYRMTFFVLLGVLAGTARNVLADRKRRVDDILSDLTETYSRTLMALIQLLEHHDEETCSHCERVAHNALCVGFRLGLTGRDLETLYWAGYMHDLGKLASPAKMLLKAGPLTPEEYEVMKQHAAVGADTIRTITPAFADMAEAIRAHHERWDGGGYPNGLSGEAIPLLGRILTVVDSFEAMTSDRPYRAAMEIDKAREIMRSGAWQQFDGDVVESFLALLDEGTVHVEKTHGKHAAGGPRAFTAEFLVGDGPRVASRR